MRKHFTNIPWALHGMFLIAPLFSLSAGLPSPSDLGVPWLTGPLIVPPAIVVPKGHFSIQPSLTVTANTGIYNSHWHSLSTPNFYNVILEVQTLVGMTEWMDFQTTPLALYNITQGHSSAHFGDLPLGFDFQLVSSEKYTWFPGIKLQLLETFPTGNYQKLNPKKRKTDASGLGSFYTSANLIFYKIYHLSGLHYLSMTMSLGYTVFAPVHVKGFNAYRGNSNTRGKVYPGNALNAILSFEYTFNANWVFSIDNVYTHTNKNRFSGNPGFIIPGVPAVVGGPSTEQLSFAPAIEYNFSNDFGLIAGIWFSAAGRNSLEFRSGILSCIYSY